LFFFVVFFVVLFAFFSFLVGGCACFLCFVFVGGGVGGGGWRGVGAGLVEIPGGNFGGRLKVEFHVVNAREVGGETECHVVMLDDGLSWAKNQVANSATRRRETQVGVGPSQCDRLKFIS
jgi:hypothetical protein